MAGRFVRASKYRHVFGKPARKEACYDNLHISKNAWDTNIVKVNPEYISVNWEAGGGGAFAVIPIDEKGRLPEKIPLFRGHTAPVLDTDWNPFNDRFIASASDDGKVFLWQVPEDFTLNSDGEVPQDVDPVSKLTGHQRKVGQVLFNPAAENILASASGDYSIKLWDISTGQSHLNLRHKDVIQSLSWSADGVMMVTTSRDKKLRLWDVRQEQVAHEVASHAGAKNSRAVWMGEHNRVATTGFSKMSDRQLALWDVGNPSEPINGFATLDSISGVCMPFWDEGTQCLYLAGKGDGNIRYFEYENDKFEFLSEYKSADPQRGLAFMPRRGINTRENEVMLGFKTVHDSYIEPISFTVPRRAEVFQSDIFPPAVGMTPGVSGSDWLAGTTGLPPKIDLESVYDGKAITEIPPQTAPTAPSSSVMHTSATALSGPVMPVQRKPADLEPKSRPDQSTQKTSPSAISQKASMSAMATKFQDDDGQEDEDDTSRFEEFAKPVVRPSKMTGTDRDPSSNTQLPSIAKAADRASSESTKSHGAESVSIIQTSSPPSSAVGTALPAESNTLVQSSLLEIKSMLAEQTKTLAVQSEKIVRLTLEVDTLKAKLHGNSSQEQSERIRQLELELESARS